MAARSSPHGALNRSAGRRWFSATARLPFVAASIDSCRPPSAAGIPNGDAVRALLVQAAIAGR